jgi:hypothetical protein
VAIERKFISALENAQRQAFVDLVRQSPKMSLKDLARLAKKNGMGNVTFGEIMSAKGSATRAGAGASDARAVDTRTVDARRRYDHGVQRHLEADGGWLRANQIRAACGGTPLQVRKSLARLVERGDVEWKGKARATTYRARAGSRRR